MSKRKKTPESNVQPRKQIGQMVINFFEGDDGYTEIAGFPMDFHHAMALMNRAQTVMIKYFIRMAKKGLVDDKFKVIDESKIQVVPPSKLVGMDGKMLH